MGLTEREIGLWKHCLEHFFTDQELNTVAKEIKVTIHGFRLGKKIPKSVLVAQLSKEVNLSKIKTDMRKSLEHYLPSNGLDRIRELSKDEVLAIEESDKLKGIILYKLLNYNEAEGDLLESLLQKEEKSMPYKQMSQEVSIHQIIPPAYLKPEAYQLLEIENAGLSKENMDYATNEKKTLKELSLLKKEIERSQSKLQKSLNQIEMQSKEIYYYKEESKRLAQQSRQLAETEEDLQRLMMENAALKADLEVSLTSLGELSKEKVLIIGTAQQGYLKVIEGQKKYRAAFLNMDEKFVDFTNDFFHEIQRVIVIKPILQMNMMFFIEEKLDEKQAEGAYFQVVYVENMNHLKNILK